MNTSACYVEETGQVLSCSDTTAILCNRTDVESFLVIDKFNRNISLALGNWIGTSNFGKFLDFMVHLEKLLQSPCLLTKHKVSILFNVYQILRMLNEGIVFTLYYIPPPASSTL